VFESDRRGSPPLGFGEQNGITSAAASELDGAIAEALAYDGPAIVEVISDAELI
jgi:thiamine pyrophosphate-dependent acetolactate synthase large subunit-like protein